MPDHAIIFSGAGGQGLMFIGKLLARLAADEYPHITCMPSYGAEVRGGTSNCQIILSQQVIATPAIETATSEILMNQPSVDRFLPLLAEDGVAFVNASMASTGADNAVLVPASRIALELGDARAANVVIFGAFIHRTRIVDAQKALAGIVELSRSKGDRVLETNRRAFEAGLGLGVLVPERRATEAIRASSGPAGRPRRS